MTQGPADNVRQDLSLYGNEQQQMKSQINILRQLQELVLTRDEQHQT